MSNLFEAEVQATPTKSKASAPRVRQLQQYGRIEVGQRVEYERMAFAPTVAPPPWRCWKRDHAGKIVDVNQTCTVKTTGTVVRIEQYELGGIGAVVRIDGGHEKTIGIDGYGMSPGNFASLHVIAEAPQQKRLKGMT